MSLSAKQLIASAVLLLSGVACGSAGSGSDGAADAAAEHRYFEAFCAGSDTWAEVLAPYGDDGAATLAHLPSAAAAWLDSFDDLAVPASLSPFHDYWVKSLTVAINLDPGTTSVASAEDAYALFFEEVVAELGTQWNDIPEDVKRRVAEIAPDVPGCGESFVVSLGIPLAEDE